MDIFGRTPTVDGKARTVLGDLSEDDSPFEILQTVDQKAGDDVDRDAVVQKIRELDESVDQKLATIEGDDVDQKEMRTAAGAIADRTRFSEEGAMDLLSAAAEAADHMEPMRFVDEFDALAADEQLDGELDQRAETNTPTADMESNDNTTPDDTDVDQKQENDQMNPIDLVEEILVGIAEDEQLVPSNPKPRARFVSFGDSALQYRLICWVKRPERRGKVSHELNREIYTQFKDHGIEIPYNTHDVHLHTVDTGVENEIQPVDG